MIKRGTHTHTQNVGQMLSLSTSTLRSVAEISPLPQTGLHVLRGVLGPMLQSTWSLPESFRGTDNGAALGQDTKAHSTVCCMMLLPSQRSCPPQSMTRYSFMLLSREKQVWVSFLLKETATTRIEPSTLITEYKIPDVITNALPSAPLLPPHTHPTQRNICIFKI